jgi:hypothetical protein
LIVHRSASAKGPLNFPSIARRRAGRDGGMVLSIEQRDGYGRLRLNYLYHTTHSVFERG